MPHIFARRLTCYIPLSSTFMLTAMGVVFSLLTTGSAEARSSPTQWGIVSKVNVGLQTKTVSQTSWSQSFVRAPLYDQELVQTDSRESGTLLFRDGLVTYVNSNTEIRIKDPRHVHVTVGEIYEQVIAGQGKREVDTGAAVASIEGTKFDVQVHGNVTILTVIQHTVRFSNKYGTVLVHQNQQSRATPNSAPTTPVTVDATKVVSWAGSSGWTPQLAFPPHFTTDAARLAVQKAQQAVLVHNSHDFAALLHLGDAAADTGDTQRATMYYSQALAQHPQSVAAQLGLGQQAVVSGNLNDAQRIYSRLAAQAPAVAGAPLGLGTVAFLRNDLDTATTEYMRAEQLNPADPYAPFFLGQVYIAGGNFDQAIAQEQYALTLGPQVAAVRVALGDVYALRSDTTSAIPLYRQAIAQDPRLWVAYQDLAVVLNSQGQLAEAARLLQTAGTLGSAYQRALSLSTLAFQYTQAGRPADALQAATAAQRADPAVPQTYYTIGDLQTYALGNLGAAQRAFRQAVALKPDFAGAWAELGEVYRQQKSYIAALSAVQRAIALAPNFGYARQELGLIYFSMGQTKTAIAAYKSAVTDNPQNPDDWEAYGSALGRAGDFGGALAAEKQALALAPDNSAAWGDLALIYTYLGNVPQAIRSGQQAMTLNPTDEQSLANLANAYDQAGDFPHALTISQRAVGLNPRDAASWATLADAQLNLNQVTSARTAAQRATTLDPSNTVAWYTLGMSYRALADYPRAITAFQRSVAADATDWPSWDQLSILYANAGDTAHTLQALRHTTALNPRDSAAWDRLGDALQGANNRAGALRAYLAAAHDRKDATARVDLVTYFLTSHDFGSALHWARDLATIDAAYGQFYIGHAYTLLGQHSKQAAAAYGTVIAAGVREKFGPADWQNMGILFYNDQQYILAEQALLRAVVDRHDTLSRAYLINSYIGSSNFPVALHWARDLIRIDPALGHLEAGTVYSYVPNHASFARYELEKAITLARAAKRQDVIDQANQVLGRLPSK